MGTLNFYRLAIVTLLLPFCTGCNFKEKQKPVRIGYLLCNSEQETIQRFLPLTRYLTEKIGTECVLVPVDASDFEQRFKSGDFTFARTNSLLHTVLVRDHDARMVAAEKRGNFGARTAGAIITRKGSGINRLGELAGKSMAFGSTFAPAGYLAEYDLLLAAGIDPEKDLGHYTTPRGSFKHEKIVYGVLYGAYDAAAIPLLDLEIMTREGKISPEEINILAQSELIPYCTFTAAKGVDRNLLKKFRRALIELKPTESVTIDKELVRVMKTSRIDGYEELPPNAYDSLIAMAKRVNAHLGQQ
jgi:phosphonate transport system substrate-binding protein